MISLGRPATKTALLLALVSGVFVFSATSALAATPPETPEVTVEAIAPTTATFNDVLNPAVATFPVDAGTYQYLYRKTKTLGCEGEGKAPAAPVAYFGSAPFPAVEPVTGLAPDSYYSVCLHAETTGKAVATSTAVSFESAPEAPQTLVPSPITVTTAMLKGVLDPKNAGEPGSGTYEFLYRVSAIECHYGLSPEQEATLEAEGKIAELEADRAKAAENKSTASGAVTGALGQDVEAEIPLGEPGEQYTVCLSMTNAAGETTVGPHVTFRARTIPPTVTESSEFSTEVTSSSAKLGAEVNPGGGATYRFEYGTSSEYSQSTAVFSAGSDNNEHPVSAKLGGLQPDTEYHYRVVASNESAPGGVDGPDETFVTQSESNVFALPDDRAWEQVSPVDKYGARIEGLTKEGAQIAAAENGTGIAYVTNAPLVANPEGDLSLGYSQILSSRGPEGGWSTRDLGVPHSEPTGLSVGELDEYYAFTPNLESAILEPLHAPLLAPETAKENNLFIRENLNQANSVQYTPLADNQNTPPHTQYGNRNIEFAVASPNLQHIIVGTRTQLTPTPEGSGLYEWNNGTFTPISILPDGEFINASAAGAKSINVRNAVSENGELVFWELPGPGEDSLYMRDVPQERTVQIDLPQGLSEPPEGPPQAVFQDATPNGERVYFKDTQKLTTDSTATSIGREGRLEPELYEYNTRTGKLTDLTANPEGPGHPSSNVRGEMIGASNNGEYLYLVAFGVLAGKDAEGHEPIAEEPNLYMIQDSGGVRTTTFITTLSSEDQHDWTTEEAGTESILQGLTARVSPTGDYVAFMSELRLTGYDNTDAVSHEADEEVFEYDAATSKLVCASCNPTGERPHGVRDRKESGEGIGLLVDRPEIWKNRWLAGSLPGWTIRRLQKYESDYQPRYLSDSGRLFFDSADALVPLDTNGKEDVYEYEPAGVGPENASCGPALASGSLVFEAGRGDAPAGCVGLISSGTSTKESAFLDASGIGHPGGEEGEDVFFLTSAPLSAQDVDDSGDVYDAHVCSTVSPCAGAATVVPPPCTTADSCKAAPELQPGIFGPSGSATFSGQGNPTGPAAKPAVRVLTRAQKLAAALKVCKREKLRRRRVACERTARSRYGAVRKAKKSVHADRGAAR